MKFFLHNSSFEDSEVVLIGIPDESGSRSKRKKGVSKAPDSIRMVSNERDVFGKNRKVQSQTGIIKKKICDIGNVEKNMAKKTISKLVKKNKVPIILGGDHSITSEILAGFKNLKDISLVYFDAHPDIRCTREKYYGSVVCDVLKLDFGTSINGDVNQDDDINILDVVMTVNIVLSGEYNNLADFNNDGAVDVLDIVQLVNLILNQ